MQSYLGYMFLIGHRTQLYIMTEYKPRAYGIGACFSLEMQVAKMFHKWLLFSKRTRFLVLFCLLFFFKSLEIQYIHTPHLVIHIDFLYLCLPA